MRVKRWFLAALVLAQFCCAGLDFGSDRFIARAGSVDAPAQDMPTAVLQVDGEPGEVQDPRDTLSVSASVSPSGMAVPSEAQVYLTLVNGATDPISDIEILKPDGKLISNVGTLSGSGKSSGRFDETVTPTYKQLKAGGIEYLVRYTLGKDGPNEAQRELTVLAPIERLKAEPSLDFTRKLSASYAHPGEQITITYRLKNTGNVALTDLVLKDQLCGEVGRVQQLSPGEKAIFPMDVVIESTSDSKPSVSYAYVNSDSRRTEKLDPLTIYLADEWLDAHLDADKSAVSPGEIVMLQLKLANRGNVTYDKLEISDQVLGSLGSVPIELRPTEEYVFLKRVTLKATTTFLFTVSGKSASGSPVSSSSNMLTVAVTPVVDSIELTLSAEPDQNQLSEPGNVTFRIKIHNEGQLDIRNVILSEQADGEIKPLAVVPPGDDTIVEQSYYVKESRSFVFMAELSDSKGDRLTVYCNPPVDIHVESGGAILKAAEPETTHLLGIEGTTYRMDERNNTFNRMLFGVLGVLGVLVSAFVISGLTRLGKKRKLRQLQLRKLRKGRRNARLDQQGADKPDAREDNARDAMNDTGVYRKTELIPKKELP